MCHRMTAALPPPRVLDAAGLRPEDLSSMPGTERAWLAETPDGRVVIRDGGDERDTAWLHRALDALDTSFPAPRPVCLFGDESTFSFGSRTWDAVTFPPGRPVGFGPRPTLAAIGAFLARFHLASLSAGDGIGPRPGGARLAQLASLVDWEGDTSATVGSETKAHRVRAILDGFASALGEAGYEHLAGCVIHGNPTTFNVLADGDPPASSGLIDFELADLEAPVADIAFCLWRSGRAAQSDLGLDLARVAELIAGYHTVRPLNSEELRLVPVCLKGDCR